MMTTRLPQRFVWREHESQQLCFGVCVPTPHGWNIQELNIDGPDFDFDPWETLGQWLGDVSAFAWIDCDYGWFGGNLIDGQPIGREPQPTPPPCPGKTAIKFPPLR